MRFALLFLPLLLFAKSTFITPFEYASSLYKNPRGIGCHHCHGEHGEGRVVARYNDKKKQKEFAGPKITSVTFERFEKALNRRVLGMPRYFLTQEEIKSLYFYLNQIKKESDGK